MTPFQNFTMKIRHWLAVDCGLENQNQINEADFQEMVSSSQKGCHNFPPIVHSKPVFVLPIGIVK